MIVVTDENVNETTSEKVVQEEKDNTLEMLERAEKAAERIEKANAALDARLAAIERIRVQETFGGRSSATGRASLSEEQKADREAKEFIKGSGFEDELFPE